MVPLFGKTLVKFSPTTHILFRIAYESKEIQLRCKQYFKNNKSITDLRFIIIPHLKFVALIKQKILKGYEM